VMRVSVISTRNVFASVAAVDAPYDRYLQLVLRVPPLIVTAMVFSYINSVV